jgi:hypothetical protein
MTIDFQHQMGLKYTLLFLIFYGVQGALSNAEGAEDWQIYDFRVAAFDRLGNPPEYTAPMTYVIPGTPPPSVLAFVANGKLIKGSAMTLSGVNLSTSVETFPEGSYPTQAGNAQVLVNGIPALLTSVSPSEIRFVVTTNLAGDKAIV